MPSPSGLAADDCGQVDGWSVERRIRASDEQGDEAQGEVLGETVPRAP